MEPRQKLRNLTPAQVIQARSRPTKDGCWKWLGARDSKGYGRLQYELGQYLAHRFSYAARHGEIPEGLTIDHLCRNTGCVNPSHMELVTPGENARRGNFDRRSDC